MPKTVGKSPKASPASKAKPIRKRAKAARLGIAYPNACGLSCGSSEDRANFNALLAEFRTQLNAVRPDVRVVLGGPEVSY